MLKSNCAKSVSPPKSSNQRYFTTALLLIGAPSLFAVSAYLLWRAWESRRNTIKANNEIQETYLKKLASVVIIAAPLDSSKTQNVDFLKLFNTFSQKTVRNIYESDQLIAQLYQEINELSKNCRKTYTSNSDDIFCDIDADSDALEILEDFVSDRDETQENKSIKKLIDSNSIDLMKSKNSAFLSCFQFSNHCQNSHTNADIFKNENINQNYIQLNKFLNQTLCLDSKFLHEFFETLNDLFDKLLIKFSPVTRNCDLLKFSAFLNRLKTTKHNTPTFKRELNNIIESKQIFPTNQNEILDLSDLSHFKTEEALALVLLVILSEISQIASCMKRKRQFIKQNFSTHPPQFLKSQIYASIKAKFDKSKNAMSSFSHCFMRYSTVDIFNNLACAAYTDYCTNWMTSDAETKIDCPLHFFIDKFEIWFEKLHLGLFENNRHLDSDFFNKQFMNLSDILFEMKENYL